MLQPAGHHSPVQIFQLIYSKWADGEATGSLNWPAHLGLVTDPARQQRQRSRSRSCSNRTRPPQPRHVPPHSPFFSSNPPISIRWHFEPTNLDPQVIHSNIKDYRVTCGHTDRAQPARPHSPVGSICQRGSLPSLSIFPALESTRLASPSTAPRRA